MSLIHRMPSFEVDELDDGQAARFNPTKYMCVRFNPALRATEDEDDSFSAHSFAFPKRMRGEMEAFCKWVNECLVDDLLDTVGPGTEPALLLLDKQPE